MEQNEKKLQKLISEYNRLIEAEKYDFAWMVQLQILKIQQKLETES